MSIPCCGQDTDWLAQGRRSLPRAEGERALTSASPQQAYYRLSACENRSPRLCLPTRRKYGDSCVSISPRRAKRLCSVLSCYSPSILEVQMFRQRLTTKICFP